MYDKEYHAKWYQANKERLREARAAYYREHQEHLKAYARSVYQAKKASEKAPWLVRWLKEKGLTPEEAQARSGIDTQVFDILLKGGRTVPGLALIAGHNLGMTPAEVRNIGVTLDPSSRRTCENLPIDQYPWHTDQQWWNRVDDFPAERESRRIYGGQQIAPVRRSYTKLVQRPNVPQHTRYTVKVCEYCRKTYHSTDDRRRYCSVTCAASARELRHKEARSKA